VIRDRLAHELAGRLDLVFAAGGARSAIEMLATLETIG